MTPFPHNGSEIDDRVYADWLDDQGRYDEADALREEIGEGPQLSDWAYVDHLYGGASRLGVGGSDRGIGGVGGGVGGVGSYSGIGGDGSGVGSNP